MLCIVFIVCGVGIFIMINKFNELESEVLLIIVDIDSEFFEGFNSLDIRVVENNLCSKI